MRSYGTVGQPITIRCGCSRDSCRVPRCSNRRCLRSQIIAEIEEALNAKIVQEVTTPKVMFSGFPANMGEAGVRMTLAAFGEVVELSVEDSDDGLTCMVIICCSILLITQTNQVFASSGSGGIRFYREC